MPLPVSATPALARLLDSLGARYSWGGGHLSNGLARWPDGPWDCSGFAQAALLVLGIVRPDAWDDRLAAGLANACDPIQEADAALGDLAFYGRGRISHVTVCLGGGVCIGANGGTPRTHGDDPNACVQVRPLDYRADFVTVGRLKAQFRRAGKVA